MRLLHIVTVVDEQSSYGGPLTVALNQCQELRKQGHEATILAGWLGPSQPPRILRDVPCVLFPVRPILPGLRFSALVSIRMLIWILGNFRTFDVLHIHLARDIVPLTAGAIARLLRVPYVTQTHGMVVPTRRLLHRIVDRASTLRVLKGAAARLVLTTDEERKIRALQKYGQLTHLPNGVPETTKWSDLKTYPPNVLFLSRLHPRKRVLDFAEAAARLAIAYSDVTFTVVGPDDGDLDALQTFLRENPILQQRLSYEGGVPADQALMRLSRATVYALPSIDEPFPMSLLEAMSVGTASICTNSCGISSDLAAEGAAIVIEPGPENLASAISDLLRDDARRAEVANRGRSTVVDRYSIAAVGRQLERLYCDARTQQRPGEKLHE